MSWMARNFECDYSFEIREMSLCDSVVTMIHVVLLPNRIIFRFLKTLQEKMALSDHFLTQNRSIANIRYSPLLIHFRYSPLLIHNGTYFDRVRKKPLD